LFLFRPFYKSLADTKPAMAAPAASALVKRHADDMVLMPPPPIKRIKRPPKVLDEDDYTSALSQIIARDYFPGLIETQAQQEYLTALESNNEAWIAEAGQKLRNTVAPVPAGKTRRSARNTRFDTPSATPQHSRNGTSAAETPRGWAGGETPGSVAGSEYSTASEAKPEIDTSNLSLGAFQAKYTSEDNESFNSLLDKQNEKNRQKHAYLWTADGRIPSPRQIAHRTQQQRLLTQKADDETNGKALVAITTGATDSRPAKPDSWQNKKYDNTFMFNASSVDEDGLETIADVKEANSKAPPKAVVHNNTRFPVQALQDDGPVPPSPSLNTSIIARRDAARAVRSETEYSGGETPRVNGYSFVDEDEPGNIPQPKPSAPSYRDLLAGQVGDGTPNPFRIVETRKREDLHHRMVERENAKKRTKALETVKGSLSSLTPSNGGRTPGGNAGNMTPAARRLMEKLGRTPKPAAGSKDGGLWTPGRTPRRNV
jgi:protein DGCR14